MQPPEAEMAEAHEATDAGTTASATASDFEAIAVSANALDLAGVYQSRSADGKSVMLLQVEENGQWNHVARRADSTQYYWFPSPTGCPPDASPPVWWPFGCVGGSSSSSPPAVASGAPVPRDTTVTFWEMAESSGTWSPCEDAALGDSEGVDIIFRCNDSTWSNGQSDPSVSLYQLHQAVPLPQERQRAQELAASGRLTMRYTVRSNAHVGHRVMGLRSASAGAPLPWAAGSADQGPQPPPAQSPTAEAARVAAQALGFMRRYADHPMDPELLHAVALGEPEVVAPATPEATNTSDAAPLADAALSAP